MNKDNIKNELSKLVTEVAVSGEKETKKAQNVSKKENDAYYKDVEKKMSDYDKDLKTEDDDAIEPVKNNIEGDEKDYHDEMEIRNGQEMLNYDNNPGEKFTDRAIKAIEGDSTMGNKTYTGDENGNTESVWGASNNDFGKELGDKIRKSKKKRDDSTPARHQFGDDIEVAKGDPKVKSKKNAIGEGMKRIKFKKSFNGIQNAINLIPEAFKVEDKKFELTDGNEKYLVEWKDNHANILEASDKNVLSESFDKIKHLMGFKVGSDSGTLDANARVNENTRIMENATGVAFGTQGNGFTSEGDLMGEEVIDESEGCDCGKCEECLSKKKRLKESKVYIAIADKPGNGVADAHIISSDDKGDYEFANWTLKGPYSEKEAKETIDNLNNNSKWNYLVGKNSNTAPEINKDIPSDWVKK